MTEPQLTNATELRRKLNESYNDDELRTLCADLGVDYDNLEGETKQSKVREMVDYLRRRERVYDLIELVSKQRPHVNWYKLVKSRPEQQRTSYSLSQKRLVISVVAISSVLVVVLVALLIRELFVILATQPLPTSTSLPVTSTPQPTPMPFSYAVQVIAEDSGQPLPDARVTLYVIDQAPLPETTDVNGYARILIDAHMINQPAKLDVQARGYERQTRNIDLRKDKLPEPILLRKTMTNIPPSSPTPRDTPTTQLTVTPIKSGTTRSVEETPEPPSWIGTIEKLPFHFALIAIGLLVLVFVLFNAEKLRGDNQQLMLLLAAAFIVGGVWLWLKNNNSIIDRSPHVTPTIRPSSSSQKSQLAVMSPVEAVTQYYQLIKAREYQTTWNMLTSSFKDEKGQELAPQGQSFTYVYYKTFWDSYTQVKFDGVKTLAAGDNTSTVQLRLSLYRGNVVVSELIQKTDLVRSPSTGEWLINHTELAQKVQWIPDNDRRGTPGLCTDKWIKTSNGPICPASIDFVPWDQLKSELEQKVLAYVPNVPHGSVLKLNDYQGQLNWIVQVIGPSGNEIANIWIGTDPLNNWSYDGMIRIGSPVPLAVWATFRRYSDASYWKQ